MDNGGAEDLFFVARIRQLVRLMDAFRCLMEQMMVTPVAWALAV